MRRRAAHQACRCRWGDETAWIWSAGYGVADVEQQVSVDPATTKFRVGSVAKPMTALALVTLATRNRIDLDADVRRYVPAFPRKDHTSSVRQLAGHLAGIRHYAGDEAYSRKHYRSVSEALEIFRSDPLAGVPGAQWKYSSYGYNLLSAVIENASGKPFVDTMSETVFRRSEWTATVPDQAYGRGAAPRPLLRPSRRHPVQRARSRQQQQVGKRGFLSTTDDLVRFGLAHVDGKSVSPEKVLLLWTEQKTADGASTGYGIGWRIVIDGDGRKWIGHGGGSIGGTTQFWVFPESGLVIAMAKAT